MEGVLYTAMSDLGLFRTEVGIMSTTDMYYLRGYGRMRIRIVFGGFAITALLMVAVAMSGCGKADDNPLATIGDDKITVRDFKDYTTNLNRAWASADEEFKDKRILLDSLIVSKLLIREAYKKGLNRSEEIARVVLANRDKFLLDVMYQKNVISKSGVTDAEVREFYNNLEFKLRASQILVGDLETAQDLFVRAKAGENFELLAYENSTDPGAKRNRGDLGYFVWGAMVEEFQEVAFQLQPGQISPPVKTNYGYHIIKVTDKQPNESRRDFESMKKSIRSQISNKKRVLVMQDYLTSVKAKYPFTIDTSTCKYVMYKREQLYPPQILATLPRSEFDLEQLDRNERELVIATWEGGEISLQEYLVQSRPFPTAIKPDLDDYDSLLIVIRDMKMAEILSFEADKQGLENSEEFKRKMKLFSELSMADLMRNDSISSPLEVTERMSRKYYDSNLDKFTRPRRIHLFEILTGDELLAIRLVGEIRSLEQFKDAAAKYTERPAQRGTNGDLGNIEDKWFPEIFPVAWSQPVGKVAGPVQTLGKHSIFYVLDKNEAEVQNFLDAKRAIVARIQIEQRQKAFAEWVENRRAETTIEVFEDELWTLIDRSRYDQPDTARVQGG